MIDSDLERIEGSIFGVLESLKNRLRILQFRFRIRRRPLRLVIGASGLCDKGWTPSEIQYLDLLNDKHWASYFTRASIDAILAEHVWEHLTVDEGFIAARRCYQYLRPGGYLRVAVPDGYHPDPAYIAYVKPGGSGPGADDHKILYNHITFSELFEKVGFRVTPLEYFDAQGLFHNGNWREEEGKIIRSSRFDTRNRDGSLNYTSIILDAHKDDLGNKTFETRA
jgi:predicted SAM-dependent methyltransferase